MSSATDFMLASPIPAPKPISRIQSGAVEKPGCRASLMSGMPGPWSTASKAISSRRHLGHQLTARGAVDDDVHLGFVRYDRDAANDARMDAQTVQGLLELAGSPPALWKSRSGTL